MHATLSYQQHARKPYYVTRPKWQPDLTSQGKGVDFKFSTRYIQISLQRRLKLLFVYIHIEILPIILVILFMTCNFFYSLFYFFYSILNVYSFVTILKKEKKKKCCNYYLLLNRKNKIG